MVEHHRGGEQHAARVRDACPGEREAAVRRRHEEARAVLGEQPVRGDAGSGRRGGDLDQRLRPLGRDHADVEAARVERRERDRHARR